MYYRSYLAYLQIGKTWWGALVEKKTAKLIHVDTWKWTDNGLNSLSKHFIRYKTLSADRFIIPHNTKFPYCGARRLESLESFNWSVVVRRDDLRLENVDTTPRTTTTVAAGHSTSLLIHLHVIRNVVVLQFRNRQTIGWVSNKILIRAFIRITRGDLKVIWAIQLMRMLLKPNQAKL